VDEDQQTLLTRRRLIATGAVMAAGAMVPQANASAKARAAAAKQAEPPARYTRAGYRRARFAPHVGQPVALRPRGGAAVAATLAAIHDVPYVKGLAGDQDAYTLCFRGPATPLLPEGVVAIVNERFGAVELYIAPVASAAGAQDYLAVINRRVPRSARRTTRARRA
jgi:hypothetical protein